ncbi:hypothetical protein LJR234_005816 [Mesorhizobium amorphae]|uniref:hypothetical protein n=1 Tax=Mesorhizobium amorphae TaxID=71433 RepID=UPI003ECCD1BD
MMPDLSCRHPRVSGMALSMGTKRKRSGSLGLTEPFHRNLAEYSNLHAFFTPKNGFLKNPPPIPNLTLRQVRRRQQKPAAIARSRSNALADRISSA